MVFSLVGVLISLRHAVFYRASDKSLSRKMRNVFLTDGFIYAITLTFGVWAFFGLSQHAAYIMHWVRLPLLAANIYASIRLYKHYQIISDKGE